MLLTDPAPATLTVPLSHQLHVSNRLRRRSRRASGAPLLAAIALAACALGAVLVDRAYAAAAPAHAQAPASGTGQPAGGDTLSPGACLALGPTGPSRGRTVFVDPGHGGPDPGVVGRAASGQELRESAVALAVATDLAGDLRADGYRVVLSRSGDTSVLRFLAGDLANGLMSADQVRQDLRARVRCANRSDAAAL